MCHSDRWVLTRSRDSNLVLWLADIHDVIDPACRHVSRNLTADEWSLYFPGELYRPTCSNFPSLVGLGAQQANKQVFDEMDNWFFRVELMIILVPVLCLLLLGVLLFFAIRKLVQYRSAHDQAGRGRNRQAGFLHPRS